MTECEDEASLSNTATASYKGASRRCGEGKPGCNTFSGCVEPATGVAATMVALRGIRRSFFQFLPLVTRLYPGRKVAMVLDNVMYHHAGWARAHP